MTPLINIENDADGVRLTLRDRSIVLPPAMANELAQLLLDASAEHDPATVRPQPVVTPSGDPIV